MKNIKHFSLSSLGCPKNRVDSEKILAVLITEGFEHTQDQELAEIIVINTCAFIQPAVEESIAAILDSAASNPEAYLIVAGCLPLRYGESLKDLLPEVDLFLSPYQINMIPEMIRSSHSSKKTGDLFRERLNSLACSYLKRELDIRFSANTNDGCSLPKKGLNRVLSTPGYAYLRISDGCNHGCKFCAIPLIRGRLRSESVNDLVREAAGLADCGVKEIVLIAQDLTSYGRDLGIKDGLARLLEKLELISGIEWIRLMYLYPSGITPGLTYMIRDSSKILPYLDVPIQHISEKVLRSMGRPWNGLKIRKMIESFRSQIPGISIRTTLMVGFPTETEDDFAMLEDFVKHSEIDHVGVFKYFQEEGSPAEKLGDPIPKKTKNSRARKLRSIHSTFVKKKMKKRVGKIETAIVEGFSEETEMLLQGRTWDQAPDVDGKLYITDGEANVGEIVKVLITETKGVDLFGEIKRS
ncbi:MAG: 30S ribosomal protein S12 methylthiotransferase RimO [Pseudomonadota bacterium]